MPSLAKNLLSYHSL